MQNTTKKINSITNNPLRALEAIEKARRILIIISGPDLDSLGSGIILKKILIRDYKKTTPMPKLICESSLGKLIDLPYSSEVEITDPVQENYRDFDLVITLDTANPYPQLIDRKKYNEFHFPDFINILSIDHHLGNEGFATINIHEINVSSTCELIYKYFVHNGKNLQDAHEATLLLAGISGDTGHFLWNTTTETLKISSELVLYGADLNWIINFIFFTRTKFEIEFAQYCLSIMNYYEETGCTIVVVDRSKYPLHSESELKAGKLFFNAVFSRSIIDYPIGIFILSEENISHVNLLGNNFKNTLDLTRLSLLAGGNGGGHFHASGYSIEENPDVVVEKLLKLLRKMKSQKNEN